ncbi:hypothetical protein [Corallococcus exercitus]
MLWAAALVLFAMLSVGMSLRPQESRAEEAPRAGPLKAYVPPIR